MGVVIIEGITGAGKSSTIRALQSIAEFDLTDEDATFDDFMTQFFADPTAAAQSAHDRMASILDRVQMTIDRTNHVIERFYFSQLALGSDWNWYRDLDTRCAALNCKVAVLTVPRSELALRSLYRAEFERTDWQSLIGRYGSEPRALEALAAAQQIRTDAVRQSHLEHRVIDTSDAEWDRYAMEIADWMGWRVAPATGNRGSLT